MSRQLVRLAHRKRSLKVGFDHVFRRRQDVGDEVVAQLDVGIKRAADLELFQCVQAGGDHGGKADGENDPERDDRGGQRQANFHGEIQATRQIC